MLLTPLKRKRPATDLTPPKASLDSQLHVMTANVKRAFSEFEVYRPWIKNLHGDLADDFDPTAYDDEDMCDGFMLVALPARI